MFGISDSYNCMHFFNQFLLFIIVKIHVPFGQSSFPSSVLDKDESNL
jgi:hypothetical protein